MNQRYFLLAFLGVFFFVNQAFAQTDFRQGYVITLQHDTLKGYIDYASSSLNSQRCLFKPTLTGKEQIFHPAEIYGYRYTDSKFYVSKNIKLKDSVSRSIFAEYLIEGKVSVYYYNDGGISPHYLLEKEGLSLREASFGEEIAHDDEKYYLKKDNTFRGVMRVFMAETPEIYSEIDRLQRPGHADFIRIAKHYHELSCSNQACVVYEKTLPKFSFSIEPVLGCFTIRNYGKLISQYGGLVYFWLPQENERIYFKTGYLYAHTYDVVRGSLALSCIPIQFEYLFPKAFIRPKIFLGINNYISKEDGGNTFFHTYVLGAGAMIPITANLSFDCALNTDYLFTTVYDTDGFLMWGGFAGLNLRF